MGILYRQNWGQHFFFLVCLWVSKITVIPSHPFLTAWDQCLTAPPCLLNTENIALYEIFFWQGRRRLSESLWDTIAAVCMIPLEAELKYSGRTRVLNQGQILWAPSIPLLSLEGRIKARWVLLKAGVQEEVPVQHFRMKSYWPRGSTATFLEQQSHSKVPPICTKFILCDFSANHVKAAYPFVWSHTL